jgi:hypothetical protein
MKSLCYFITLWLVFCCHVHAQTTATTPGLSTTLSTPGSDQAKADPPVCSPLVMSRLNEKQKIAAMQAPLNEAVTTIDSAKIEFSSPSLASGKMNYVTITPNFADNMSRVCIIGYFYLGNDQSATEPFNVDHIEIIRQANPNDAAAAPVSSTRIFFRAPNPHDLLASQKDIYWKFWTGHIDAKLKFAAFDYDSATGERGKAYFGHSIPVQISHEKSSIFKAVLFGLICYFIAAFTISYHNKGQNAMPTSLPNAVRSPSRIRVVLRKLSPWYLAGSSGHASLSQLQMLLFTLIVATLLFYQWTRTGLLQEISTDLLYLIGISTIGAGGAQVANSIKKNLDPAVYDYLQRLGWFTAPIAGAHSNAIPSQLLLTNGRFDIYKFQMLVFTFVIAAYVIMAGGDQLGNIQISATLLSLMGMSQGVYIGGQITTDSVSPFQDQLRGMQMLQASYDAAAGNPAAQAELAQRFELAAQQAAEMFNSMFNRDIPPFMLKLSPSSTYIDSLAVSTLTQVRTPAESATPAA